MAHKKSIENEFEANLKFLIKEKGAGWILERLANLPEYEGARDTLLKLSMYAVSKD